MHKRPAGARAFSLRRIFKKGPGNEVAYCPDSLRLQTWQHYHTFNKALLYSKDPTIDTGTLSNDEIFGEWI